MIFTPKHIDVGNPDEMALVKVHWAHPGNPFIFRIECQIATCSNRVWPSQLYDVRGLPADLTTGVAFACDGCVERWVREPDQPLDVPEFMRAQGADNAVIDEWLQKCEKAKPDNVFLSERDDNGISD